MTETPARLVGSAARIAEMFGPALPISSMYGPDGSKLYDNMLRGDRAEIDEFLRVAKGRPGPVLELACGNGRTTLPLLEQGYDVIGLDSSPDMLERLRERLRDPANSHLAGRLSTVESDMSEFSLDRRFGLVILGMATVWMLDSDQRASLFRCVHEHLAGNGRFLLTLPSFPNIDEHTPPFERTNFFTAHDGTAPVLCVLVEHVNPQEKRRSTNMLAHRVENGQVVHTALYVNWSNLISLEELGKEIEGAGMRVVAHHPVGRTSVFNNNDDGRRERYLIEVAR
jgi:SAM-dependent methyltransferase